MTKPNFDIQSEWADRVQTPAEVGDQFLNAIDRLSRLHPSFCNWGTSNDDNTPAGQPLEPLRKNFAAYVQSQVERDDWDQLDPDSGYTLWAANAYKPFAPPSPNSISLLVTAGAKWRNHYNLEAGSNYCPPNPKLISYPVFKAALLTLISIWPAPWANTRAYFWGGKNPPLPDGSAFPYSGFKMPWIAYLSRERAADLKPSPNVVCEVTPDGGLLMIAAEARFDPGNATHLTSSAEIARIMIDRSGRTP